MKKTYETPLLVVHGTVEDMTQAIGSASATDTIFYAPWGSFPGAGGSQDGIVVPYKP
jgi:hypothetical protein